VSETVEASEFKLGEGKISGALSLALSALGLLAVLCLWYPSLLTTPDMREIYPMALVRALIQTVLVLGFALGLLSVVLSKRRVLGLGGIFFALLAMSMGGASVEVSTPIEPASYLGLDWFVLNLFFLALVFVPMERAFARLREQRVFRAGWKTDVAHFFVSHMLVQVTVLLTMMPAAVFFGWMAGGPVQSTVANMPLWVQFCLALVLADLFAYGSHRMFHAVPFLWRFHAIHHSSAELDWIAGSRLHLVDILVTRAVAFIPLYMLGFSPKALYPYLVFASLQAVFIHANVRFRFGWLRHLLVTPQFHHWHHTAEPDAIDKNFAVHLPVIDRIFGTYHLPKDRWSSRCGIDDNPVPEGWLRQLTYPFTRRSPRAS
jgi:sterol desaturase/sphingolipid hydroxylase (fatty acid hydroxylase superfamily)